MKSLVLICAFAVTANCATLFNYGSIDSALSNYDTRVRPFAGEKPTEVEVSMYAIRAYNFNQVDKEFNLDLYFRQKWTDPRLTFSAKSSNDSFRSNNKLAEKIWRPDTFFSTSHADKLNVVTMPNIFISIKPDGQIMISGRYTTSVPCKKDADDKDKLICSLEIESYGFDVTDIDYKWKPNAKQEKMDWPLEGFDVSLNQKEKSVTLSTGVYKILVAEFVLKKN